MTPITARALVASDSLIARDPRVLKQVRWLSELGYTVDTLGRGDRASEVTGVHYTMPRPSTLTRVVAYLFLPNRQKYQLLIENTIPQQVLSGRGYEVVALNEIELLPWFEANAKRLVAENGTAHLDLHEYAPSQRVGLAYRLVFKRYRDWLISFIPSSAIATRSVVATGIAKLYAAGFGIPQPAVVRSCPDFVDQAPSEVDPSAIRLIHHGIASSARRLDLLVSAMFEADERFSLELMLVGSDDALNALRKQAAPLGNRVTFRKPVDVRRVAEAINEYDLELIFIPPLTENLRFGLPNKLFEGVQGRLGFVIGESPEMAALIEEVGNGIVVRGWGASDLAAALNSLTATDVERMKRASHLAARELSSESEKSRFVVAAGLDPAAADSTP